MSELSFSLTFPDYLTQVKQTTYASLCLHKIKKKCNNFKVPLRVVELDGTYKNIIIRNNCLNAGCHYHYKAIN